MPLIMGLWYHVASRPCDCVYLGLVQNFPMQTLILLLGLVGICLGGIATWQTMALRRRFTASLGEDTGENLEQTLSTYLARVESVDKHLTKLDDAYKRLAATGSLASQKISIVRFNPFGDTG